MMNEMKRSYKDRFGFFVFFLILGGFLFQSSCVTPAKKPAEPAAVVSEKKSADHTIFQSDEYIVCMLRHKETPDKLAERFLGDRKKSWIIEDANEGVLFEKDQMIVIPLKEKNIGGLAVDGYQTVPILCYHRFAERCKSVTCMPADHFDQQMKYLKDNNYRVITLGELHSFLQYRRAIPKRSVVITIDDGYKSIYDIAYPIFKKYGFKATLFIYTDFIGAGRSAMTWNQLREMKNDGFEIGSHTLSHCDLTKKKEGEDDKAYQTRIKKELIQSKKIIDDKIGQDTPFIAFPFGSYDQGVVQLCENAGYKIGLSVKRGVNPFFSDPLSLKRDQILKREMEVFTTRLKTFKEISLR